MGGNALKNTKTRRYARAEYLVLKEEIISKLKGNPVFAKRKINDIVAYGEKPSFGDMDLLVSSDGLPNDTWDIVKDLFKPNELVRNGSCTSFDVKELQIDMILAPDREYDITAIYFSYNDLGNLMGRVAHKLGFKYGHAGLIYVVRDENHVIDEITLTRDPKEIFDFLGYSYETYKAGFNTLEEIFKFSASTPLFNKDYYRLEDRNYASRVRDRKRSTYRGFLDWIETQSDLPNYDYKDKKQEHLERAFKTFPGFQEKHAEAMVKYKNLITCKNKFTGQLVTDATGLTGEDLGQWIQGFRKSIPDFTQWVLNTSSEDIVKAVTTAYNTNQIELKQKEVHKYSRDNIRNVTGFDGRKLTMFMNDFKQKWPTVESFNEWLSKVAPSELETDIKKAATTFKYEM